MYSSHFTMLSVQTYKAPSNRIILEVWCGEDQEGSDCGLIRFHNDIHL
jgi:hypothetical protein